ncbi:MAG: LysR substrate-binding domain-containing protein [Actinomycetota bacterium]
MVRPRLHRVDRLQRLLVFESAARTGGFSSAARELGITQPAVTRHVVGLERTLGTSLFERGANRATLTDDGRRLADRIGAGLDLIESGLADLEATSSTFVLAAHPGIAQQWLMPRIDELHEALGDLEVRLQLFERDAELGSDSIDSAVRIGDGVWPGCSSHRLFEETVVPVASAAFAAAHGLDDTSTAADVHEVPFIHMNDGDSPWMTWAEWLARFEIHLQRQQGRVMWNNYPLVLQQALAGRGVALGWRPLVDDLLAGGALVVVGPSVRSGRGYYVTWPEGPPSPGVDALIELFAPNG